MFNDAPPPSRELARIKGAALLEFLRWYVGKHGRFALTRAIAALPPDYAATLDGDDEFGVIASNWYLAPVVHALLDRLLEGLTVAERRALVADGARAVMASTLKGVYRFLFERMMSPERYAQNAQRLWSRYYDTGLMVKTKTGPTTHLTRIGVWSGHHPVLCDLHVASAEYIYEAMGCRDVVVRRTGCVSDGDSACSFVVSWRE